MKNRKISCWRSTEDGAHFPVYEGQTTEQALKEFLSQHDEQNAEKQQEQQSVSSDMRKDSDLFSASNSETDFFTDEPIGEEKADFFETAQTANEYAADGSKLTITDAQVQGAKKLYDEIASGKYYDADEILSHPTVRALDEIADGYLRQYGDTSQINTPERLKMRQEIERDFLSQGSMVKDKDGEYTPTGKIRREHKAIIAIGLPAAGKSTVIANPESERLGAFVFDSDDVKTHIPEFMETNGGAAGAVHNESKIILNTALAHFLKNGDRNGDNLVIPVIGSNFGKLQRDWINKLEDAGYDVEVQFKEADPKASMNRVISRAIKTGRIIPSDKVVEYGDKPREVYQQLKSMTSKHGKPYVRQTPKK